MKGFKQFLKIYFLFLSIGSLSGQDLIVMQSGKELFGKITDITSKEVKYIKYKSTDQKKISLMKADIFMIKYKNGKKILFDSPNSSPVTTTSNVAINQTAPVPANETSSIKESNISNDSINKRDEKNRNANFISPFKTVSLGFDGFGFLMFGPRIISELRITPKTYLSAHL